MGVWKKEKSINLQETKSSRTGSKEEVTKAKKKDYDQSQMSTGFLTRDGGGLGLFS